MKAVVKGRPTPGAVLTHIAVPKLDEGDVLVKVEAASICGIDYQIYAWNEWSRNRVKPPLVMGREFSGEVVALGPKVKKARIGDYVSAETRIFCSQCVQCKLGEKHVCQNAKILGVDVDGVFAEYACVPEENLWYTHPSIPPDIASIQASLGSAVQAVMRFEPKDKSVAVFGCEPIGLMAIGAARAMGAAFIVAIDINDYRLKIAKDLGADIVINGHDDAVNSILDSTHGVGVDVVLEMSGAREVYTHILKVVRAGGSILLLGLPSENMSVDFSDDVVMRGLTIQGITGRVVWDTWDTLRKLITSGRIDLEPIITHRLSLDDFAYGMEVTGSGNGGKVVLYPE
jgi:threonine 3-dehydrogenase